MKLAAGDAADEGLLLLGIGLRQVVGKGTAGRKRRVARLFASRPRPRLVAGDSQRAAVGRLRRSARSEESLAHFERAFAELRRAEAHMNIFGVLEYDVEVGLAIVARPAHLARASVAPSAADGLQGMAGEHPVADIQRMNVL